MEIRESFKVNYKNSRLIDCIHPSLLSRVCVSIPSHPIPSHPILNHFTSKLNSCVLYPTFTLPYHFIQIRRFSLSKLYFISECPASLHSLPLSLPAFQRSAFMLVFPHQQLLHSHNLPFCSTSSPPLHWKHSSHDASNRRQN